MLFSHSVLVVRNVQSTTTGSPENFFTYFFTTEVKETRNLTFTSKTIFCANIF